MRLDWPNPPPWPNCSFPKLRKVLYLTLLNACMWMRFWVSSDDLRHLTLPVAEGGPRSTNNQILPTTAGLRGFESGCRGGLTVLSPVRAPLHVTSGRIARA